MAKRTPARNAALEQRVLDAPDDPAPRIVYGDWLQSVGDPLGEWIARSGDDAYLAEHAQALLGRGAALWPASYLGWRHGFLDELRMQHVPDAVRRSADLFARPIARFVRRIAIAPAANDEGIVDAIVAAAPPLLAEALVVDGPSRRDAAVDALADLATLRSLSLYSGTIERVMPQLRELAIAVPSTAVPWVVGGGCPNVEVLTLDCRTTPAPLSPILAALRKLRVVRVIGAARDIVDSQLADHVGRIERVEVGDSLESWVVQRVRARGRDEVALLPFAGVHLHNAGERLLVADRPREAVPLVDASITFPFAGSPTRPWVIAAIANERAGLHERAIAVARGGLLRRPQEVALHAVLVDAQRNAGRVADALAQVPAVMAAIDAQKGTYEHGVTLGVLACLRTLAAANQRDAAIAFANKMAPLGGDAARELVASLT